MPEESRPSRFPVYQQILLATALGLVAGPWLGKEASAGFGELGKLFIQVIKAITTPLLFLVIVNAVLKTHLQARSALRLLGWATLNACLALVLGLGISNLLRPGEHLEALVPDGAPSVLTDRKVNFLGWMSGLLPDSLLAPFVQNNVITVVLLALLFGMGLRRVRSEEETGPLQDGVRALESMLAALLRLVEIVVGWAIQLAPFAVFGIVTKAVGEHGYRSLGGVGIYLGVALLGLGLHVLITYNLWIGLLSKLSIAQFWRVAREPAFYSMGTNSSLATLPVTLRALERLGVSKSASTLGACVGTNFNNDGIILYEGMAVLVVAQAAGIDLTLSQQLVAAGSCLIAAMGVAGVPEAGFISLALVLNTVGLPAEILPLLLTVDWIIGRARSVVNVLSDMVLSILIDRGTTETEAATQLSVTQPD